MIKFGFLEKCVAIVKPCDCKEACSHYAFITSSATSSLQAICLLLDEYWEWDSDNEKRTDVGFPYHLQSVETRHGEKKIKKSYR